MRSAGPQCRSFDDTSKLAEFAGMRFLFICPDCQHGSEISATKLMMLRGGAARVADVLATVQCSNCGRKGAPDTEIRPFE
jgi:transcription elongation factor Elf1